MEGHVNTYGGLDKDTAYDSIKPNMYIDALNVRISTDRGESTGAYTNMKGNELSFTLPTSGTFDNDPPNPPANWNAVEPEIIGYATIRDTIVLFVADNSGSQGWIYKVNYDAASRVATPPELIYYSDILNFKKQWPIEGLGRYENGSVQKVYWTDYNNLFRTINIADPELNVFPVSNIDIYPDVKYTQPIVDNISGGGELQTGMYQIAYRLITSDGKETLISPPSNMIHIVASSEFASVAEYVGDKETVNTFKSITISIDTSDYLGLFEQIEIFSLYYESPTATPIASSIEIINIIDNVTTIVYQGTEDSIFDIELFTFASKNFAFKTFKTVAQKDNYLVGANIKSSTINLSDLLETGETFESKTKRYNSSDSPTPGTLLDKAFNKEFNKDKHWDKDWQLAANQYKYQKGGTILGGGDPATDNISYSFHLEPMTVDIEYQADFHNVGGNIHYAIDNHDLDDGYGVRPNPSSTIPNTASPIVSSLLRGYKRGETYRFGIVFYTTKGEATYVEYIGDIKFPDISEADGVNNTSNSPHWPLSTVYNDSNVIGKPGQPITVGLNLGIKFNIDFSSCQNLLKKINGFQIVRVDRENTDKRRLCQGIMSPYANVRIPAGGANPAPRAYDFRKNNSIDEVLHQFNTPRTWKYSFGNPATYPNSGVDSYESTNVDIGNDSMRYFIDDQDNDVFTGPHTNYSGLFPPNGAGETGALTNTIIKSQYLAFYSPEVSYNFNNIPDLAINSANNASLLVTGCYTTVGSPSPPDAEDYREEYNQLGGPQASDLGNAVIDLWDSKFKFRRVGPVSFNSIENIRKIASSTYFDMRDSSNVTIDTKIEQFPDDQQRIALSGITAALRPQMPGRDIKDITRSDSAQPQLILNSNGATYVRNYFAYIGARVDSSRNGKHALNDPKDIGSGPDNRSGGIARAGTNISVLVDTFDVDPLDSTVLYPTAGTDKPWRDYFLFEGNTDHTTVDVNNPQISPGNVPDGFGGTISITKGNAIPIVDLVVPKNEIYGGFTANALEANSFIPASPVIQTTFGTDTYNPKVYGGDIFLSMFHLQKAMVEFVGFYQGNNDDYENIFTRTDLMVTESTINLSLNNSANTTRGIKFTFGGSEFEEWRQEDNNSFSNFGTKDPGLDYYKTYSYNPLYSQISKEVKFFVQPSSVTDLSLTNDIRAFISGIKVNGEAIDSWTQFAINDFHDVDDHGPINKIINFKNNVYFFQDQATGVYSINREAITTTDDGVPTELGTAKGWGKHQYNSEEVGSIHQWAVAATNTAIYFFDAIHRKIYQLGQGKSGLQTSPLSELKGMHSYLQELGKDIFTKKAVSATTAIPGGDNPILLLGAHIGVDEINNEIIFTFLSKNEGDKGDYKSIVFDELANQFSTELSTKPNIWINNGDTLLSPDLDNSDKIYAHNIGPWGSFYDTVEPCRLTLVINPKADINKVLRFLEFNSIVRDDNKVIDRTKTITGFKITTETQSSDVIYTSTPESLTRLKRRFDKWRIKLPRDKDSKGRFRSTHFLLTLYFDNTYNKELIMNRLVSYYNPQIF